MTVRKSTNIGDAAWAHNRWPAVGLYAGAGVGLVFGVVRLAGWAWAILYVVVLAVAGCLTGLILANLIYRSVGSTQPDDENAD